MSPSLPDISAGFVSLRRGRAFFDAGGNTILMYHKIGPVPLATNIPVLYVSARQFARQMDGLLDAGLPCLTLEECAAGTPGFCLTFDDGFRNAFEHTLPALQSRGLRAIQFLVAGVIGGHDEWDHRIGEPRQPLMDDAQVREWLAAGQEIGAHTMTHPRLTTLPPERARAEIFDSKHALEDRFGQPVRHFCYPYGDSDPAVRDLVAEAGFATACTIAPGINRPGVDPLGLTRIMACDERLNLRQLAARIRRRLLR